MKLIVLFVVGLLIGFHTNSDPVYFAQVTSTRTYMSSDRVTVTGCWFTKDKMCTLRNQIKMIVRNDLGVIHIVNLKDSTYKTDSIKLQKSSNPETIDVKYVGQFYEPTYEWRQTKQLPSDTIDKYKCDRYICEGDADFDQISLEFSLAKVDNALMAEWLTKKVLNITDDNNKREPLTAILKKNKNMVPLQIVETVENAIAPYIKTRIDVDKLGLASNAEGIFEIPQNFKKTN